MEVRSIVPPTPEPVPFSIKKLVTKRFPLAVSLIVPPLPFAPIAPALANVGFTVKAPPEVTSISPPLLPFANSSMLLLPPTWPVAEPTTRDVLEVVVTETKPPLPEPLPLTFNTRGLVVELAIVDPDNFSVPPLPFVPVGAAFRNDALTVKEPPEVTSISPPLLPVALSSMLLFGLAPLAEPTTRALLEVVLTETNPPPPEPFPLTLNTSGDVDALEIVAPVREIAPPLPLMPAGATLRFAVFTVREPPDVMSTSPPLAPVALSSRLLLPLTIPVAPPTTRALFEVVVTDTCPPPPDPTPFAPKTSGLVLTLAIVAPVKKSNPPSPLEFTRGPNDKAVVSTVKAPCVVTVTLPPLPVAPPRALIITSDPIANGATLLTAYVIVPPKPVPVPLALSVRMPGPVIATLLGLSMSIVPPVPKELGTTMMMFEGAVIVPFWEIIVRLFMLGVAPTPYVMLLVPIKNTPPTLLVIAPTDMLPAPPGELTKFPAVEPFVNVIGDAFNDCAPVSKSMKPEPADCAEVPWDTAPI